MMNKLIHGFLMILRVPLQFSSILNENSPEFPYFNMFLNCKKLESPCRRLATWWTSWRVLRTAVPSALWWTTAATRRPIRCRAWLPLGDLPLRQGKWPWNMLTLLTLLTLNILGNTMCVCVCVCVFCVFFNPWTLFFQCERCVFTTSKWRWGVVMDKMTPMHWEMDQASGSKLVAFPAISPSSSIQNSHRIDASMRNIWRIYENWMNLFSFQLPQETLQLLDHVLKRG